MAVKSKPYFWIECDGPDCDARCPDPDGEIVAWSEEWMAVDQAVSDDWECGDDGKHLCPDCINKRNNADAERSDDDE